MAPHVPNHSAARAAAPSRDVSHGGLNARLDFPSRGADQKPAGATLLNEAQHPDSASFVAARAGVGQNRSSGGPCQRAEAGSGVLGQIEPRAG